MRFLQVLRYAYREARKVIHRISPVQGIYIRRGGGYCSLMLSPKAEKKLDRIADIQSEIESLETELEDLLTGDSPTLPASAKKTEKRAYKKRGEGTPAAAPTIERKKGQKVCKICGIPGHIAKTCPTTKGGKGIPAGNTRPAEDTTIDDFPVSDKPLTREQYDNIKLRRENYGDTSEQLEKDLGLDRVQLKRAIRTKTYEEYLG